MKKYIFGAVLSIGLLMSPAFSQAAGLTTAQINAIISILRSFNADQSVIDNVQISLTGGVPATGSQSFCHNFNSDLTGGNSGEDVTALNHALSSSGIDTTSNSSKFDENNAGDVVLFQAKYGIRQTGYVGPLTRAKLNALYGCRTGQQSTVSTTQATTTTQSTTSVAPTQAAETRYQCPNGSIVSGGASACSVTIVATPTPVVSPTSGAGTVTTSSVPPTVCNKGDVDADGAISRYDANLILRQVVGLTTLSDTQRNTADVNGDSVVTLNDSIDIGKYVARQITAFSACAAGTIELPVVVKPDPTLTVSASPLSVSSGQSSTITWTSANSTSCTISANSGQPDPVQLSGSRTVSPNITTTYVVMCEDYGVQVSKQVMIEVTPPAAVACSKGDADSDGLISLADQQKIMNYVVGLGVTFTSAEMDNADVNGDGIVNLSDSIDIGKYVARTITTFSACAAGTTGLPRSTD